MSAVLFGIGAVVALQLAPSRRRLEGPQSSTLAVTLGPATAMDLSPADSAVQRAELG